MYQRLVPKYGVRALLHDVRCISLMFVQYYFPCRHVVVPNLLSIVGNNTLILASPKVILPEKISLVQRAIQHHNTMFTHVRFGVETVAWEHLISQMSDLCTFLLAMGSSRWKESTYVLYF